MADTPPKPVAPPPPAQTAQPAAAVAPLVTPEPPPKTEKIVIVPDKPARPIEPPEPDRKGLQTLTETISVLLFIVLTIIPIARTGIFQLTTLQQNTILTVVGLFLAGTVFLYQQAKFRPKGALEARIAARRRDDAILNALSVALVILLAIMILVELVATLVFLKVVKGTTEAVVTAASHFVLFSTFTLLFIDMLLIARTTFDSRFRGKGWHRDVSYFLIGTSVLILLLALLKNLDLLNVGLFRNIRPEQSPYIVTLAAVFQLFAYRMLLRYPSMGQVFSSELEMAKRATRDERIKLERRALQMYFVGLLFVLLSFMLIGGVATGRVATGDQRSVNIILTGYIAAAVAILIVLLFRYVQHRFLHDRARRAEQGELIAHRRLTREQLASIFIYTFSGIFGLLFLTLGVLTFLQRTPFKPSLGTDFLIMAFLVGVGPFGFRRAMYMRRVRAMDDKFPDFLRDMAEGLRAGMTLPRALYVASRGIYGALTPEIQQMSAQVEWGISFNEALERFAERVKTPLIQRSVSLVSEAAKAGGNVVDILTAASNDAREIKMILEDRRRQMGIYSVIIYVAFMVFLVVIYVLAAQFLPSFQSAVGGAQGTQVGGLSFAPFKTITYVQVFYHAALIQGIGGGLVAGMMTEGHPLGGLKHSFIMAVLTWVFFRGFL